MGPDGAPGGKVFECGGDERQCSWVSPSLASWALQLYETDEVGEL
jgi:hypothetical protein